MQKDGFIIVTTTTDSEESARAMAHALVESKLAACVEYHRINSIYPWKGHICDTAEYVLVIKTCATLYTDIEQKIRALHTYELPQIIAVPITYGLPGYLAWIGSETMVAGDQ